MAVIATPETRLAAKIRFMRTVSLSKEEQAFFVALGERIALSRKELGLTQGAVAEALGLSQQTIDGFEKGRRRVQVYALVRLAELFKVSVPDLLGGTHEPKKKRGPESGMEQRLVRLRKLPKRDQKAVLAMLDGLLESRSSV